MSTKVQPCKLFGIWELRLPELEVRRTILPDYGTVYRGIETGAHLRTTWLGEDRFKLRIAP